MAARGILRWLLWRLASRLRLTVTASDAAANTVTASDAAAYTVTLSDSETG